MLPQIDMIKTGENIKYLRKNLKLSVRDLQDIFEFNTTQAIYKWERGVSLPSIDNILVLSKLFNVTINDILIIKEK